MTSQSIIQGIVLLLYLIAMVMVGFVFYKKNSTHSDYVLGGRGMNVWVTSLSAQASDMSGCYKRNMDCNRSCTRYIF